jgi:hypothetical protein
MTTVGIITITAYCSPLTAYGITMATAARVR